MEDFQTGMPARDVTKQIADIVVGNTLTHYGGVHTIPTIGDPGKFALLLCPVVTHFIFPMSLYVIKS